ncbi:MAG: universal stress protein [Candidatus Dormibacteria bacterium]
MYRKILVGTDGLPSAQKAVSKAAELAELCGAELHIVTVIRTGSPLLMEATLPSAMPEMSWAPEREEAIERILEEASRPFSGRLDVQTHGRAGDPGEAILEVASATGADLIVLGNRGMQGYRRILGSVPNHVSHAATCSLLIVQTS